MSESRQHAFVPLSSLEDAVVQRQDASLSAAVTLIWPYSSSTGTSALLLAEPDFRLRHRNGQVRVKLRGAAARAVARSGIGIGDTVELDLAGARWTDEIAPKLTPGRSVDGQLVFRSRIKLHILRAGARFAVVDINEPPSPSLVSNDDPIQAFATPDNRSPAKSVLSDEWTSPAFRRLGFSAQQRPVGFDIFNENDGLSDARTHKRHKPRHSGSNWSYQDNEDSYGENGEHGFSYSSPSRPSRPSGLAVSSPLFPSSLPHPQTSLASPPVSHARSPKSPVHRATEAAKILPASTVTMAEHVDSTAGDQQSSASQSASVHDNDQAMMPPPEPTLRPLKSSSLSLPSPMSTLDLTQGNSHNHSGQVQSEENPHASSIIDFAHSAPTESGQSPADSHQDLAQDDAPDDEHDIYEASLHLPISAGSEQPSTGDNSSSRMPELSHHEAAEPEVAHRQEDDIGQLNMASRNDNLHLPLPGLFWRRTHGQADAETGARGSNDLFSHEEQHLTPNLQDDSLQSIDGPGSTHAVSVPASQHEVSILETGQEKLQATNSNDPQQVVEDAQQQFPTPHQSQEDSVMLEDEETTGRRRSHSVFIGPLPPPTPQASDLSTEPQYGLVPVGRHRGPQDPFWESGRVRASYRVAPSTTTEHKADDNAVAAHPGLLPPFGAKSSELLTSFPQDTGKGKKRQVVSSDVEVPLSPSFTAKRQKQSDSAAGESNNTLSDVNDLLPEHANAVAAPVDSSDPSPAPAATSVTSTESQSHVLSSSPVSSSATESLDLGYTSSMAYYPPLNDLKSYFSATRTIPEQLVDAFAVLRRFPFNLSRGVSGGWYTDLHIVDSTCYPKSVIVECFSLDAEDLPRGRPGDIIILRNFLVVSSNHELSLQSRPSSSWLVWKTVPKADEPTSDDDWVDVKAQIDVVNQLGEYALCEENRGTPLETVPDERTHAYDLKRWWFSVKTNNST